MGGEQALSLFVMPKVRAFFGDALLCKCPDVFGVEQGVTTAFAVKSREGNAPRLLSGKAPIWPLSKLLLDGAFVCCRCDLDISQSGDRLFAQGVFVEIEEPVWERAYQQRLLAIGAVRGELFGREFKGAQQAVEMLETFLESLGTLYRFLARQSPCKLCETPLSIDDRSRLDVVISGDLVCVEVVSWS